jgi:hypothetical protein
MNIYAELSRIQRELKAPKNLYNKYGNYYYRNAESILEAVKPLLNSLVILINDEPVQIGERYYIKATVSLTDGENTVTAVAYAREDEQKKGMDGCQLTGACSSYARKYALNALLMIDDSKDSDDDSLSPKNPKNSKDDDKTPPQKQFTPPPAAQNAKVTTGGTVPQVGQAAPPANPQTPPPAEISPVVKYLMNEIAELRKARGIDAKANRELFAKQLAVLQTAGLVPKKPKEEYTMQEAESLIAAMYSRFDPHGTELKEVVGG